MITAAGSATLEAVFYNIPLIILGALSPVTYFLARFIFRVNPEYIGLPNIILGKKGVPEFVQFEINPDRVSEQTLELLRPEIALPLIQIYEKIRQQCAYHPFPITEAAKRILSINQND